MLYPRFAGSVTCTYHTRLCSLQLGGALNAVSGTPGSCTPNVATARTRIGDIAITPYSGDKCSSRMPACMLAEGGAL